MKSDQPRPHSAEAAEPRSVLARERNIIALICAVQFVNILEFMMVLPLGPDFARDLGIETSKLGFVGASYTAAAAVAGLIAATFIDKFDRRTALASALLGLVVATLAGAVAFDLTSMLAARILAGAFGGPAAAVAMAIVTDTVPPKRRGRAMGVVMGAFAIASVLGVPLGLELARIAGWRTVFYAVSALTAVLAGWCTFKLPRMNAHRQPAADGQALAKVSLGAMLLRPIVLQSLTMTATLMMGNFMIIPNLATFLQFNLGYPRDHLSLLYLAGGFLNFFALRLVGRLTDRFGPIKIGTMGTLMLATVFYVGFIADFDAGQSLVPVVVLFSCFMVTTSFRNVPYSTLSSQVPRHFERARFMSIQSAVQNISSALGAGLATQILSEGSDGALIGMPKVATVALIIVATLPVSLWVVQRGVRRQQETLAAAA